MANIESDDLFKRFDKIYVFTDEQIEMTAEFDLVNSNGDSVLIAKGQLSLNKGKNVLAFENFVNPEAMLSSALNPFYQEKNRPIPGNYVANIRVGRESTQMSFVVKPAFLNLEVDRKDTLKKTVLNFWLDTVASSTLPVFFELKWINIANPLDTFSSTQNTPFFELDISQFKPERPYRFWMEEVYELNKVSRSDEKLIIPKPKRLELSKALNPKIGEPGIQLPQIDSVGGVGSILVKNIGTNTKLYGNLGTEYFRTTNGYSQNPFGRSSLMSNGSIGVDVNGIPIKSNLLFTWYERTGVQLFDVSLELDFDRLRQNLESRARERAESQLRERINYPELTPEFDTLEGQYLRRELSRLEGEYSPKELDNVRDEIQLLKSKGQGFDGVKDASQTKRELNQQQEIFLKEYKGQVNDSLGSFQSIASDSASSIENAADNRFEELKRREQSLDSLKGAYDQTQKRYDRFQRLHRQYLELKAKGIDIHKTELDDLKDPSVLSEFLPEGLKKYGNTVLNIKSFEMGWSHADFSYFTLNQKAISGLSIDYRGKYSGIKAIKGTTNNGFDISGASGLKNTHSVLGFRTSLFKEEKSEVAVNYVKFDDRNQTFGTHQSNTVLSIEANQALLKNLWFTSELSRSHSVSMFNAAFQSSGYEMINSLFDVENLAAQAHSFGLELKPGKTSTRYGVKSYRVGSGFQSLGNPFIISDRKGVLVDIQQAIADNRLLLLAKYARETNNLSRQFADTGLFHRYQIGVVARLFNKLNFNAFYIPVVSHFGGVRQRIHTLNSTIDVSNKLRSVKVAMQLGHTLQANELQFSEVDLRITELISSNLILSFRKGGNLRVNVSKSTQRSFFEQERVNATFSYFIKKKIRHSVYTDLQRTNLYGRRYVSGTGLEFKLKEHFRVNMKCGYSIIERTESSSPSDGLDMNLGILMAF